MILRDGQGLKPYLDDAARDIHVWRKSAETGAPDAQYLLGLCYWWGSGVPYDEMEMVRWLRKAAEQGYAPAQSELGTLYYNAPRDLVFVGYTRANSGCGISQDCVEAVRWWRKAANHGYAPSQYSLGTCFYKGHGVPQDHEEGLRWIRKAAEQGAPNAASFLQELRHPGFWLRFAAAFIDGIILCVPNCFCGYLLGFFVAFWAAKSGADRNVVINLFLIVPSIVGIVITWLYYALMESSPKQATLGKMACGFVVTDLQGHRISFGQASGRHFGKVLSMLPLGIGFLMCTWTERKQCFHDDLAGCLMFNKW
jgi:uncharacterized RDD family membrane protein YckC